MGYKWAPWTVHAQDDATVMKRMLWVTVGMCALCCTNLNLGLSMCDTPMN